MEADKAISSIAQLIEEVVGLRLDQKNLDVWSVQDTKHSAMLISLEAKGLAIACVALTD